MKTRDISLRGGLDIADWQNDLSHAFEWQGKPVKEKLRLPIKAPPSPILESDRSAFMSAFTPFFSEREMRRFSANSMRKFQVSFEEHEGAYFAALEEIWCRFEGGTQYDLSRLGAYVRTVLNQRLKDVFRAWMCRRAMERKAAPFWSARLEEARDHRSKTLAEERVLDAAARVQCLRRWFFQADERKRKTLVALAWSPDASSAQFCRLLGWRDKSRLKHFRQELRQVLFDSGMPVLGSLKRATKRG